MPLARWWGMAWGAELGRCQAAAHAAPWLAFHAYSATQPTLIPFPLPSFMYRPRVPPASPVVFDVSLVMIPGLEDEEEE